MGTVTLGASYWRQTHCHRGTTHIYIYTEMRDREGWVTHHLLLLLCLASEARAGINMPYKDWLCNYCAMGPQEDDDCGTPILCMFYGLLLGILALTIYTTIKGTTE